MKNSLRTLLFAAALGIACATALTSVAEWTKPLRKANKEAEKWRNLFDVFGIDFKRGASHQELKQIYDDNIKVRQKDLGGLKRYEYAPLDKETGKRDKPIAIAVEFAGAGLWKPIKGFLALSPDPSPDMKTIRGITFYEQEETPSLGGKIEKQWFRDRFVGKSIYSPGGEVGIRIVKKARRTGAVNEIDAISGATLTCKRVEIMVNEVLVRIVKEGDSGS